MMNEMTAKEAIKQIKSLGVTNKNSTLYKALDKAIQALEAQPSEDCISRESVRELICQNNDYYGYSDRFHEFTEKCLQLPPVTPERLKGKWIFCYGNRGKDNVEKCSCCKSYWKEAVIYRYDTQEYLRLRLKYCPKCGAEMEEDK